MANGIEIRFEQPDPAAPTGWLYFETIKVCQIWRDVDGYWKADLSTFGDGFMESHHLRAIADKLDELNAPYEAQLKEYFERNPPQNIDVDLDF